MANGTHDGGSNHDGASGKPLSDDAALSARLGRLDQRLSSLKDTRKSKVDYDERQDQDASARASALARGFRLSSELVAGVAVGAAIEARDRSFALRLRRCHTAGTQVERVVLQLPFARELLLVHLDRLLHRERSRLARARHRLPLRQRLMPLLRRCVRRS